MSDAERERQEEWRQLFGRTAAQRRRGLLDRQTREAYGVLAITEGRPARYIVQRPSQVLEEWSLREVSGRFEWEMLF